MRVNGPSWCFESSEPQDVVDFLKAYVFYHCGEDIDSKDYLDDLPRHTAIQELLLADCCKNITVPFLYFEEFMVDNLAWEAFVNNFKQSWEGESIEDYLFRQEGEEERYISGAFVWSNTEEGREYWAHIDKLWEEECNGAS